MKLLISSRAGLIGLGVLAGAAVFAQGITVQVNGQPTADQGATMVRGTVLVPLRDVTEGLGATVQWDQNTQTITLTKDSKRVTMTIGGLSANANDQTLALDVAPRVISGVTMVPARFIGEAFGATVNWNPTTEVIDFEMPQATDLQSETVTTTAALHNASAVKPMVFGDDASTWITKGQAIHFTLDGSAGGTAVAVIPGLSTEVPMKETSPGHYEGTWSGNLNDQLEDVHDATVMGKLTLNGNSYYSGPKDIKFDTAPPTVDGLVPTDGTTIGGFKPVVSADYMDLGSGIDPSKVSLSVNGQDVTPNCAVTNHSISYTLPDNLAPGNYKADLTVTDRAGNTATKEWNFSVMGGADSSNFTNDGGGTLSPGQQVNFSLKAVPGSQVTANIGDSRSIPMTETSSGIFTGSYTVRDHDLFGGNLVTATITPPNATTYTIQCQQRMGVSANRSLAAMTPVISSPLASQQIDGPLIVAGSAPAASMVEIHVSYTTRFDSHTTVSGALADEVVTADTAGNFQTKPLHISSSIGGSNTVIRITATTVLPDGTRSPESKLELHPQH